ncbi:DUF4190 domain-containing protein [Nocardia rhizosphaerihabitans]|uniref:DUF4190 domain-containing protein n=1 Tax=Nocardia rhizosphaerihabitans TaxID=1691570 RepID=UPI00366FF8AD
MTNPGDSDEWWKQYGGSGVSPESGAPGSVPQYPQQQPSQPSNYPSTPQYPQQPAQPGSAPQYPQQPSQPQYPNYQQPSAPQYPQPQQPPAYGAYPAGGGYQPYGGFPPPQGTNGLAIGALVSSLVGLCTCIGSIVGIVLGIMALNQIKERGGEGRGMALAGIWIGAITIVLGILYFVFVFVLGMSGAFDSSTSTY